MHFIHFIYVFVSAMNGSRANGVGRTPCSVTFLSHAMYLYAYIDGGVTHTEQYWDRQFCQR